MKKQNSNLLEKGNIYFFYRPKVEKESSQSLEDVQHFFFVLQNQKSRQIIIGKKSMPASAEVNFGFVDKVSSSAQKIGRHLQEKHYSTKTRGERTIPEARAIAEGKYCFIRYKKNVHLLYQLEISKNQKKVQQTFQILPKENFIINVKNPLQHSKKGLSPKEKASFPKKLQEKFGNKRFIPLDPPEFLDYEGAEILLIGEKSKPNKDWKVDIEEQFSNFPHEDMRKIFEMDISK